jgi:hypothetical protein
MCVVQVTESVRIEPGERRQRMHVLHLCFGISPVPKSLVVTVHVTTPLLYIDEYPADASRGFDVPATRVSVPSAAAMGPHHPQGACMRWVSRAYTELDAVSHSLVRAVLWFNIFCNTSSFLHYALQPDCQMQFMYEVLRASPSHVS